jgi:hypothetical protein
MTEIEKINSNINGEMPENGETTIFTVTEIENPDLVLDNCKQIVKALLSNNKTKPKSDKWRTYFPANVVAFIDQLTSDDFGNDEALWSIESIVEDFQDPDLREWEWYSSKVEDNGFKIVFKGWCSFRNYWMIHCQMIPYSKITIEDKFGKYQNKVIKDVTTYKDFTF